MDWRSFVMHTYQKLKKQHPGERVTLKHAMVAAREPYRMQQQNMYRVRGELVQDHRRAAAKQKGSARVKSKEKADRLEAVQYGGVLDSMREGWDLHFEIDKELEGYSKLDG